jgi:hypothetical protein
MPESNVAVKAGLVICRPFSQSILNLKKNRLQYRFVQILIKPQRDINLPAGDNLKGALSQHLIDIVILIVIAKAIDNYPNQPDYYTYN